MDNILNVLINRYILEQTQPLQARIAELAEENERLKAEAPTRVVCSVNIDSSGVAADVAKQIHGRQFTKGQAEYLRRLITTRESL